MALPLRASAGRSCATCCATSWRAPSASWGSRAPAATSRSRSSSPPSPRARRPGASRRSPVAVRADPGAVSERGWLVTAATIGALVEIAGLDAPRAPPTCACRPARSASSLRCACRARRRRRDDAELAAVAFEEHAATIARLRSRALAVPAHVLSEAADWRAPIAQALRSAEAVARLGGRPADGDSVAAHEDAVLAIVQSDGAANAAARPHDDPQPARRIARRILQRLHGMGKWGGYHTEFRHLVARLRGQRARARRRRRRGADRRRPARAEAERRPAPCLPQLAPRGRHPRADRPRRRAAGPAAAVGLAARRVLLDDLVHQELHRPHARRSAACSRRRAPTSSR